ncbi:MAG TPA: ABC transporter ATP-binding protein [Burkholderiales bacterium]|nr:ABC transporter ATP-binding protein [Burkholderiales bacterium]
MLRVEALEFGFPARAIGRDVSFALDRGEVMCVLGPNGGGKTTLFRTLLGLLAPRGGAVELGGRPLAALTRAEVARAVGYVPQAHSGYFAYSVREMVTMGRTAHLGAFSAPGHADRRIADRAIAALGIAALAERPITEISGGERQLSLVARALAQEPRLLVMDEPTASLDFGNQLRVLDCIAALARTGIAVLFSTHDPDHAFACAHRALLLGEGRALELGAPRDVIRADTLKRLYGVEVQVVPIEDGRMACMPPIRR